MDPLLPVLHATIDELDPELVVLRRDLHAHPELSRLERRTSRVVADRLRHAGLEPHELDGSGVVADLGAEHPAYRVALRAADQRVGQLLDAIQGRPSYPREHWTAVVVTDHGHLDEGGHGGMATRELDAHKGDEHDGQDGPGED